MAGKNEQSLYEKMEQQMNLGTKEKIGLFALMGFLRECSDEKIANAAEQYIHKVCDVKGENGSFNREKFEQVFGEIEAYKMENAYKPAMNFYQENIGVHSDRWISRHLNNAFRGGALQTGIQQAVTGMMLTTNLSIDISGAYGERNAIAVIEEVFRNKRSQLTSEETEERKQVLREIPNYFGSEENLEKGKSEEYLDHQKEQRKTDPEYTKEEIIRDQFTNVYKVFAEQDLSFMNNEEYGKTRDYMIGYVRSQMKKEDWVPEDPGERSVYEISTAIDGLSKELKDTGHRLFGDSAQFQAVKDRVDEIQTLVKKGSSPENREALAASMARLDRECQAYMDKNAGKRKTDRGNTRKDIVGRLQALAKDQKEKLIAPEMQEKMQKDLETNTKEVVSQSARELRDSQYARDMEKLLVLNGEEKDQAKRQISEALDAMEKDPAELGKMGDVLGKCRQAIAQMDVRKEALKELGVKEPEKLSKDEMRKILTAPENQDKLNDFYVSLHDMAERMSTEKTHPGLRLVDQQMQLDGKLEKNVDYERANAAILKGLSGEKAWQAARNAYNAGDRSMDITEMAALKASLGVQRQLIMENGKLSGQSRLQSAAMENLAKETEKLVKTDLTEEEKRKFRDYGKAAEGLTLEDIFKGNERMPVMDQAVAGAVSKKFTEAYSSSIDDLGDARNLAHLQASLHTTQLDRSGTVNSLLAAFMGMQGVDFCTAFDDSEMRKKAAKDMKAFLESHGSELDEKGEPKTEKDRQNIHELTELYKAGYKMVRDFKMPDIDYNDPIQRAAHKSDLRNLMVLTIDMDQNITDPSKIGAFQEGFGGKEILDQTREGLLKEQSFTIIAKRDTYDDKNDDMNGLVCATLYGDEMRGKTLGEIAQQFKDIDREALYFGPPLFSMQHMSETDAYLSGEKKIAPNEVFKSCQELAPHVDFGPLKDRLEKDRAAKKLDGPHTENRQERPSVEKMDLKDLMKAEGKSSPRRHTVAGPVKTENVREQKERRSLGGPERK